MQPNLAYEEGERGRRIQRVVDGVRRALPEFELLEEIGRGGTAVIFKAREIALDREVAIKIVTADLAGDSQMERLFLEEARAIAKLDHPNIIQIYSAGRAAGSFYLVLQHVPGETLDRVLAREGRLGPERALRIAREVAAALETAHRRGVIHRDIKPSNVMVRPEGCVKVMDFGIAGGHLHRDEVGGHGLYIGTPLYSSPEQCRMETLDGRSDLYSLGVVLYEMLTGTLPHVGASPEETIDRVAEEEPIPLEDVAPELSPEIHRLASRLMARDRERRFAGASAAVAEIDRILERRLLFRGGSRLIPYRSNRSLPPVLRVSWGGVVLVAAFAALLLSVAVGGVVAIRFLAEDPVAEAPSPAPEGPAIPPVVVAAVEVDPSIEGTDPLVFERETLYAFAGLDRAIARSPEWLAARMGSRSDPESALEAVLEAFPAGPALLVRGRVRPEGQRILFETEVIELPGRRIALTVRGSAEPARAAALASRIARALSRALAAWLETPPDERRPLPPAWIDLDEPERVSSNASPPAQN